MDGRAAHAMYACVDTTFLPNCKSQIVPTYEQYDWRLVRPTERTTCVRAGTVNTTTYPGTGVPSRHAAGQRRAAGGVSRALLDSCARRCAFESRPQQTAVPRMQPRAHQARAVDVPPLAAAKAGVVFASKAWILGVRAHAHAYAQPVCVSCWQFVGGVAFVSVTPGVCVPDCTAGAWTTA